MINLNDLTLHTPPDVSRLSTVSAPHTALAEDCGQKQGSFWRYKTVTLVFTRLTGHGGEGRVAEISWHHPTLEQHPTGPVWDQSAMQGEWTSEM